MESIYKIDTGSDHVAKFRGDRPRELGDLAAKKKLDGQGKARREAARRRNPSAKSISVAEITLAAMAVGLQPYSER